MSATRENILERIAARTRERCRELRERTPIEKVVLQARELAAEEGDPTFPFEQALRVPGMSFICECKKASPSKGLIDPDFHPAGIAREYERAGAAAISCLTEPYFFEGKDKYLTRIANAVDLPVLRKDFVVDEYMIYQAKVLGAHAVLLICSILSNKDLRQYVRLCHKLGLSALVEAYEPDEVPRALAAGARVVGVNNRDLRTFEVDFGRSISLRPLVGSDRVFVSESGVHTAQDVARLAEAGVDAVLIGETLMRAPDKRAALDELRSQL
ncbi:MAG: indole-3-glycerol phosphate synthase TrpC [Coriobacteriales bacterium]|nr:indole-3-glycerol phosphate synthase TrpC [Coriobacteriales bacterium]